MLPYQLMDGGSFTSSATVARQVVQITDQPDLVVVRNRTAWGDDAAETSVEARWAKGMAQDAFQSLDQAVTTGILSSEAGTANGFRIYTTAKPPAYAALATTAITAANPAVVSMADTGSIGVGDVVRLDNTTGMLQVSGYDFEVTAVTTNTSININIDAQNEGAAATAGNVRLIIPNKMFPRRRFIVPLSGAAGITAAANAVVSMSVAHDFSVGEKVRLKVPSAYGMTEANQKLATVLSVTTYSVTLDLDSSAFTAFALPTSAIYSVGVSPAEIVPVGAGPIAGANPPESPVNAAFDNRNQWQVVMGSNIITSTSVVYDWMAYRFDKHTAL